MSILDIKERFSKRILDSEKETKKLVIARNGEANQKPAVQSIQESDVGITEFVSDLPGFHAVIKQRFSDFNVHEIDMDRNIAKLTNYDLPDESLVINTEEECPIDESTLKELKKLVEENSEIKSVDIDVTSYTKDRRKRVHQYIKSQHGSDVVSNTSEDGDKKLITVSKTAVAPKDRRRPGHLPKFLHFVLSKSNVDTTEAFNVIASKLRVKASLLSAAGTKDKRANTSQWVCIKNMYASQLKAISKSLRRIWLGNFVYKNYSLALGSLRGNNFEIALRGITISDEKIENSLSKLNENGFINYFGLQRFGNSAEAPTHEIGKQLIKEAYGKAVELILKPRYDPRHPDMQQARAIYAKSRDADQAFRVIRNKDRSIEGKLLYGLKTHGPNAYVNALDNLPRNVRLLYLHAYQSYLWNRVASRRFSTYGLSLREGDLVQAESTEKAEPDNIEGDTDQDAVAAEETLLEKPCPVKHITAENLGDYSIYDIMLPVPGTDTVYPNEEIKEWYSEVLAEDGLTFESLYSRIRQYALTGSYRRFLHKLQNLTWRVVRYNHPEDDLILNDVDLLAGKTIPDRPDGEYKAVIMSFDLDRSTYATMALREVLRSDTSTSAQTELNGYSAKREGEPAGSDTDPKRRKDDEEEKDGSA